MRDDPSSSVQQEIPSACRNLMESHSTGSSWSVLVKHSCKKSSPAAVCCRIRFVEDCKKMTFINPPFLPHPPFVISLRIRSSFVPRNEYLASSSAFANACSLPPTPYALFSIPSYPFSIHLRHNGVEWGSYWPPYTPGQCMNSHLKNKKNIPFFGWFPGRSHHERGFEGSGWPGH